jgi:hypothetical protein
LHRFTARQTTRLRLIEKARLEEIELQQKLKIIVRMQRIFRHYLPVRLARWGQYKLMNPRDPPTT